MPVYRDMPWQTVLSLLVSLTAAHDSDIGCQVAFVPGISDIEFARCICVHRYLTETKAKKLFFIDSDMQWSAETFMRMLALSTKMDIVCGAYPRKKEPIEFLGGTKQPVWNDWECVSGWGGGLGFAIFDRKVIETMARNAQQMKFFDNSELHDKPLARVFYKRERDDGYIQSEDVTFFDDVKKAGFDIWCDPSVVLGHIGTKVYEGSLIEHVKRNSKWQRKQSWEVAHASSR
jgi:hypothetical protein